MGIDNPTSDNPASEHAGNETLISENLDAISLNGGIKDTTEHNQPKSMLELSGTKFPPDEAHCLQDLVQKVMEWDPKERMSCEDIAFQCDECFALDIACKCVVSLRNFSLLVADSHWGNFRLSYRKRTGGRLSRREKACC